MLSTSIPQPFVPMLCAYIGSGIRVADEGGRHRSGLGGPEPVALDAATGRKKQGSRSWSSYTPPIRPEVGTNSNFVAQGDLNTVDTL